MFSLPNGHTWITSEENNRVCLYVNDKDIEGKGGVKLFRGFHLKNVVVDQFGREWLLTDRGVRSSNGKITSRVNADFSAESNGRTYFVSSTGQIISIGKNEKSFRREYLKTGSVHVNDLCANNGVLVLATDKGLVYYDVKRRTCSLQVLLHAMLPNHGVEKIYFDSRHRMWLFTDNDGIVMIDKGKLEWLQAEAVSPLERTRCDAFFVHEDEHRTVWTVPTGGTFSYYDEATHKLVPYVLRSKEAPFTALPLIKKYFIDNQHNLWFSGDRNLTQIDFRRHRQLYVPTMSNVEVRALCMDNNGNIWVGEHDGVLSVYDIKGHLKGYMSATGRLTNTRQAMSTRIYSLFEDSRKRLWIGTKGDGLYCYHDGRMNHYLHDNKDKWSLSHNDVYDIHEDRRGDIWVATYERGLNLIEGNDDKVRFFNCDNILRQYPNALFMRIRRITHYKDVVILSTNGGLLTFSDLFKKPQCIHFYKTVRRQGDNGSLLSDDVLQTLVTSRGKVFVNTMGGGFQELAANNLLADQLPLKNVDAVSDKEGLVQSMAEDVNGDVWLVRETTVDKYNIRTNEVSTFSTYDFGREFEFTEAKPIGKNQYGLLLFPCNGGFVVSSPRNLTKSTFKPKIAFTAVRYQGEDSYVPILNTNELEVPSDKRSVTIYFSALDYGDHQHIRYAWMLEGSDGGWNYVGEEHSASFNRLPHGHLKLLVRSTNADGVWQNNTKELCIYAHPTFWESWMGWVLYFILGGGIIALAMYMFAQNQRIKLQTEMSEMRTSFFTSIGHKLRTPLTLIGGPVTEVLKSGRLTNKEHELLDMVRRNADNMLALVNSMLSHEDKNDTFLVDDKNAPFAVDEDILLHESAPSSPDTKLLVVEDNPDLRKFLFTILSSEYSVITAENGQEGLDKARKGLPDFIITDVMMPVMDGMTMVHEIKQDSNISHIPIIILSAKASMSDRVQGLREGVDDYITKPFSATYLKERVENIIARRKTMQKEVLAQLSSASIGTATDEQSGNSSNSHTEAVKGEGYHLSSPEIIDEDKVMMEKLMAYLEKNIDNSDLKMEDMAATLNLGRTVFYGKLRSIVGMTPMEFARHVRMQRAEELIAKSKMTFSQVAYAVGFTDPKYFSKCFKKETGFSPSEYRKKGKLD